MKATRKQCWTIQITDKPGQIAQIATELRERNIDLASLWGCRTSGGQGMVCLVPKDEAKLKNVISELKWKAEQDTCFWLECEDKPGVLVDTLSKIAKQGISLEGVDAQAIGGKASCWIWADKGDIEKVAGLIKA